MPNALTMAVQNFRDQRERLVSQDDYIAAVENLHGIEIGGPSSCFKTVLPIYRCVASLDGANFSTKTMWEGTIAHGGPFRYHRRQRPGKQIIAEATDLRGIPSNTYDFLISSNSLEHIANPLKALAEWVRVVKPDGVLVLVLPRNVSNFDHRRPATLIEHLREDHARDVGEDDLTHLDEILALHDLKMDPPAGTLAQFRERSLRNLDNRGLHHHIFDAGLIAEMIAAMGLQTLDISNTRTDYYALARKG
jgi:SAM-dependent methyltransferase